MKIGDNVRASDELALDVQLRGKQRDSDVIHGWASSALSPGSAGPGNRKKVARISHRRRHQYIGNRGHLWRFPRAQTEARACGMVGHWLYSLMASLTPGLYTCGMITSGGGGVAVLSLAAVSRPWASKQKGAEPARTASPETQDQAAPRPLAPSSDSTSCEIAAHRVEHVHHLKVHPRLVEDPNQPLREAALGRRPAALDERNHLRKRIRREA